MATNIRTKGSTDFGDSTFWKVGGTPTALASGQDLRIYEGADNFATNTDQSAKDFQSCVFDKGFGDLSTKVGSGAGGPLLMEVNQTGSGYFKFLGRCQELVFSAGAAKTVHRMEWFPLNPSAQWKCTIAGTFTTALLGNGQAQLGQTADFGTIKIFGGDHVLDKSSGSNTPNIEIYAGRLTLRRDWGSLKIGGSGKVVYEGDGSFTGGTVEMSGHPDESSLLWRSGHTGNVTVNSGRLDLSQLASDATRGTLDMYPASTLIQRAGGAALTGGTLTEWGTGPKKINLP